MADYSQSKPGLGAVFPDRAIDAKEWSRTEPLITASQLKRRQLWGIPLYSHIIDPNTNKYPELTDEDLSDFIVRAVAQSEMETGLTIFQVQYDEKHPFDRNWWASYGYLKVEHRPVSSVEVISFASSTGDNIFEINKSWVEPGNFHKGQINLIPFVPAVAGQFSTITSVGGAASGFAFLQIMQGLTWIPAIVRTTYTAGFPNAQIPRVINEVIGINAALEALSLLQNTNKMSSYSLQIDGGGQSVSTPGPQVYQARIEFLMEKKKELIALCKNIYGLSVVAGYV